MKLVLVLYFVLRVSAAGAVDETVFEKYPGFKDYQETCLQGLNSYFFTFLSKSIIFKNDSGNYQIQFQDDDDVTIMSLNARIERRFVDGDLLEYVQYILPNSNTFDYSLRKTGLDQAPSADVDLLAMNFKKQQSNYELSIIPLTSKFIKTGIKDYLIFGFMEVNISIQTIYNEYEATRNYIYFYKGMPNPQSSLTVKVIEESESAQTFNFIHSSKGALISPKYFFKGLQDGSMVFKEFSVSSLDYLKGLGFPPLKGIN